MKYVKTISISLPFLLLFLASACSNATQSVNKTRKHQILTDSILSQLTKWNLSASIDVQENKLLITYDDNLPFYTDSSTNEIIAEMILLKNLKLLDLAEITDILFDFEGFEETLTYKFDQKIKVQLKGKYANPVYNQCIIKTLESLNAQKLVTIRSTMNWLRSEAKLFENCESYWQALYEFVSYRQTGDINYLDDAASFIVLTGYFKEVGKEIENAPSYKDFDPIWNLTMTNSEVLNVGTFDETKIKLESLPKL